MSVVLDVQTISVVVASASVIVSAVYFLLDIRHRRRTRQTESIIKLSPWFNMDAEKIQEAITNVRSAQYIDYQDYLAKYGGKSEQKSLRLLGNYFEGIGMLVHMKLVEKDIVFNFWGDVAESLWDNNEKIVSGMRKDTGTQYAFHYWEFLVKEIKKRKIALSKNHN